MSDTHIDLGDETLIPDSEFCKTILGGASRRTAARLDRQGLPFILVGGKKFRPLGECRRWLAARIQRRQTAAAPAPRRSIPRVAPRRSVAS